MALGNWDLGGLDTKLRKVLVHIFDVWQPQATQTLTNKTLTSPAVTGLTGTLSSPTIATPTITGAATMTGAQTTDVAQTAEHGAGAIATAVPVTYRRTENGEIVTTIKIDIAGLAATGTTQGYAIGLATGGVAYIGKYVQAKYGIVYKIEMTCIETPAKASGNAVELDIDLGHHATGTYTYGQDVATDEIATNRDWAAGETMVDLLPSMVANDYIYLTTGDTGADAGVYSAGMFIIKFYGHAALA